VNLRKDHYRGRRELTHSRVFANDATETITPEGDRDEDGRRSA